MSSKVYSVISESITEVPDKKSRLDNFRVATNFFSQLYEENCQERSVLQLFMSGLCMSARRISAESVVFMIPEMITLSNLMNMHLFFCYECSHMHHDIKREGKHENSLLLFFEYSTANRI